MRVIFFIIMGIYTITAHANYADTSDALHQQYDMDTADEILGLTDLQRKIITDEAEAIESQIEQINPDIVEQNKDRPTSEKIAIYRSYLAREAYEYYKQYFRNRIELRGAETGRTVKYDTETPKHIYIELDRGKLDSEECAPPPHSIYSPCPYPDGFEDIWVYERNDDTGGGDILFHEDDKAKNTTFWALVSIDIETDIDNNDIDQDILLETSYTELDYTQYRNFEEADRAYSSWMNSLSKKEKKRLNKQIKKGQTTEEEIQKQFNIPQTMGLRYNTGRNTSLKSHNNQIIE